MSSLLIASNSKFNARGWKLPSTDIPDPPDDPDPVDPGMEAIMAAAGYRPELSSLTPSGHITVDVDGAVVQGYDISGGISIKANNVVIRDNRLRGHNTVFLVRYYPGFYGGTIEHNEVECLDNPTNPIYGTNAAIGGSSPVGCTWQYNYVHGNGDGLKPHHDSLVYRNYINMFKNPGSDEHRDCLQISGRSRITVQENVAFLDLNTGGNTGLFAQAWNNDNVPIDNIYFIGNYTIGGNRGIEVRGGKTTKPLPPGYANVDELITDCKVIDNKMIGPFRHNVWVISNTASHEIHGNTFDGQPWPEAA